MNSTKVKYLSTATATSLFLSLVISGEAQAYKFTKIADDSDSFTIFGIPAINDRGTAAFFAFLNPEGTGLFTGSGGTITTIAATNNPFDEFRNAPAINNNGTVAFFASLRNFGFAVSLFTSSGGSVTNIANLVEGPFNDFPGNPAINDSGTVAFQAGLDAGGSGIFTSSGGSITTIADSSGDFDLFADSFINNSGTVAFFATLDEGGSGIFTSSGGSITNVVDSSGPFDILVSPSINDSGTVAFFATLDEGGSGIFTSSGGSITNVVDSTGPFDILAFPSINDSGTVAFFATLDEGGSGIFSGPDPVADKVIAIGDTLFGSTVQSLTFLNGRLNNSNQIIFGVQFTDASEAIVRADPESESIPEPSSSLGLLVLGTLGAGSALKRKLKPSKSTEKGRGSKMGHFG